MSRHEFAPLACDPVLVSMHLELRFATNINTFFSFLFNTAFLLHDMALSTTKPKDCHIRTALEDTPNQPRGKTIHLVSEYPLVGQVLHQRHILSFPEHRQQDIHPTNGEIIPSARYQLNGETTSSARIHGTHRFGLTSSLGIPKFDLFSLLFFSAHHLRTIRYNSYLFLHCP